MVPINFSFFWPIKSIEFEYLILGWLREVYWPMTSNVFLLRTHLSSWFVKKNVISFERPPHHLLTKDPYRRQPIEPWEKICVLSVRMTGSLPPPLRPTLPLLPYKIYCCEVGGGGYWWEIERRGREGTGVTPIPLFSPFTKTYSYCVYLLLLSLAIFLFQVSPPTHLFDRGPWWVPLFICFLEAKKRKQNGF